ncbi:glucosaminidase domain-containing protein [Flavobacterium sp. H122]|uniref:glucosaminidase domain-containing protein n=1 Tax=Flavobacterium sp. H122 TaxID=2529860 RepID=UPI0010AB126B|nr:glucosaminidase domain-containing protein [Flavobacterium sp. H122]
MYRFFYIIIVAAVLASCSSAKPKKQSAKKPVAVTKKKIHKPEDRIVIDENLKKQEELVATSKVKVTPEIVNGYISQFKGIAMKNMKEHGVPASITLAQGILESGAGTGVLCKVANNHFGIKCHKEWTGEYVRHDDDAAQECFRKYDEPGQSYRDHSLFLTSRPWYAPLFKLQQNDYKGWARGLKKSGYATDPKYPEKLIGIIERYQLHQYDAQVLGTEYKAIEPATATKTETKNTPEPPKPLEMIHIVGQGDTLYSISKKYNISVENIKAKNNMVDNTISIGQVLIIN